MAATTQAQDELELRKAEEFIAETPKLDGIESIRVNLDEDWSGDPAMYLIFSVRRDFNADREWIKRFVDYAGIIQTKILHGGLTRFPYARLEDAA